MLELRKITDAETIEIAEFVNSVYRGEEAQKSWTSEASFIGGQRTDPLSLSEILRRPGNLILRNLSDPLVCAAHLAVTNEDVWLGMITVGLSHQGSGLGKQLLAALEHYAKETLDAKCAKMHVISIRSELIKWYQRRGYSPTGQESPFPYGNERFGVPLRPDLKFQVMEKKL